MPISWIIHYLVDSPVCFVNTYPLDSDLSSSSIHLLNNWGLLWAATTRMVCAFLQTQPYTCSLSMHQSMPQLKANYQKVLLNFIPISARCTAFFYLKALLAIISLISSFSRRRQIGVAALIFPVIPHEDNITKQTWSTSWCWYILEVLWARKLRNADIRQLYMLR